MADRTCPRCRSGFLCDEHRVEEQAAPPPSPVRQQILDAVPYMPSGATARTVAEVLPSLSRSTVDRVLKELASTDLMKMEGSGGAFYMRIPEGSLL